jgi:hypothetical protein
MTPVSGDVVSILITVIVIAVLAIFRGWIVPGRTVDRLLKSKDETIVTLTKANDQLVEGQRPLVKLLDTLNESARSDTHGT